MEQIKFIHVIYNYGANKFKVMQDANGKVTVKLNEITNIIHIYNPMGETNAKRNICYIEFTDTIDKYSIPTQRILTNVLDQFKINPESIYALHRYCEQYLDKIDV